MTRKQKAMERLNETLKAWRVLDGVIRLDPHERGIYEQAVSTALIDLEKESPSVDTIFIVVRLIDAVLSQALNRDPDLPYGEGRYRVAGNVGQIKGRRL
jgi:hypothetical protein